MYLFGVLMVGFKGEVIIEMVVLIEFGCVGFMYVNVLVCDM